MTDSPFGSYAILENIEYHFKKEPELWWEIKPPTSGDELALTHYMAQGKTVYNKDGGIETEGAITWLDILFYQVALLFGGTNIPKDPAKPVGEGGKPIISTKSSTNVIHEQLKKIPMAMVTEVADAIAEHVPGWGPKNQLSRDEEGE